MTALPTHLPKRYSLAEYLDFEDRAEGKHEFHDGEILAMSGASSGHALIGANFILAVGTRLRGKPCRTYASDLRVGVAKTSRIFHPGVTIICGEAEYYPDQAVKQRVVTNPKVLIAILSPSTEGYDRGEKFMHYRHLDTLIDYILISQITPLVEIFTKQGQQWVIAGTYTGMDAIAKIPSLGIELPLNELYAGVSFTAEDVAD